MSAQAKIQEAADQADASVKKESENSDSATETSAKVVPIKEPTANDNDEVSNLVKRTVNEVHSLMAEGHEYRENLMAKGVQFHMLNALVELGVQEKFDEQATMMVTAVEASVKAHGPHAVKPAELDSQLKEIVGLEKDLRHVRHVAGQQGIHMQALNHLTQIMKANPGDGGVQAINTFVAYADAAGIPLDRLASIRDQIEEVPASVLPDVPRETELERKDRILQHVSNVVMGFVLTGIMVWMVL